MTTAQTIDVRGLDHDKKQQLIFPAVDGLKASETLRIVFDFNPIPLVHMFRARPDVSVSFEKEGPKEWILQVTGTQHAVAKPNDDKKTQLKGLLAKLKAGADNAAIKAEAKELLQSVDATTLGLLEQELIREGITHDEIRKSLCDVHLEAMRDSLVKQRIEVQPPHPVHTFMEEHKLILKALQHLAEVVEALDGCRKFDDLSAENLGKLEMASHLLVEAEMHHDREEQCLFPMLRKHDITEPPDIMEEEHVEFRAKKKELFQVVGKRHDLDFDIFKTKVKELGTFISRELESHIFKEDNILYQIALQVLTKEEWAEVKRKADKIGYCCFKPQDHVAVVELDLRPLPPPQRHKQIIKEDDMDRHEGVCKEVMDKTEWVAIVTQGKDGPHLVATWGDYISYTDAEPIVIPVGHYNKTEENLKKNKHIQLLMASKQVDGSHGPGQGCLLQGEGEIQTTGEVFQKIKERFPWARGALVIKVKEVTVQL